MVVFEEFARLATPAALAHESALAAVTLPHGAPDPRRHVTLTTRGTISGHRLPLGQAGSLGLSLTNHSRKLLLLELLRVETEGPEENLTDICRRRRMAEQALNMLQQVPVAFVHHELDQKVLLRLHRFLIWQMRCRLHFCRRIFLSALEQRQIPNGDPPWGG